MTTSAAERLPGLQEVPPRPEFRAAPRTSTDIAQDREVFDRYLNAIPEGIWGWLAGWLSADGSIKRANTDGRPAISFQLTDRDPLDIFARILGNTVSGPHPPNGIGKKPIYIWKVSGWQAAMVLDRLRPWLSDRYLDRLEAVEWAPRRHHGQKITPEDAAEIKACLIEGQTGSSLAERYGISKGMVSRIKRGSAWGDVAPARGKIEDMPRMQPNGPRLDEASVHEIRALLVADPSSSLSALAERFGVTRGMVRHIKTGRAWSHAQTEEGATR